MSFQHALGGLVSPQWRRSVLGSHFSSFVGALLSRGCCISTGSSFSLTSSTCLPLPLFLSPIVIPVSVRGDVLGQFSSSSQSVYIPPKIQSLEISTGCGIMTLYLPL